MICHRRKDVKAQYALLANINLMDLILQYLRHLSLCRGNNYCGCISGGKIITSQKLSRRPLHFPASQNMDVKMVYSLGSVLSIVNNQTETVFQALLLGNSPSNDHEMSKELKYFISHYYFALETLAVQCN
jgi:hypothetical protein